LKLLTFDNNNKPRLGGCITNSGALSGRGRVITVPRAEALGYGVEPLRRKFDTHLGCTLSPYKAVPYRVFCGLSLELFARPVMNSGTVLPKAAVKAGKMILRLNLGVASAALRDARQRYLWKGEW
jgi:hypothetical protein